MGHTMGLSTEIGVDLEDEETNMDQDGSNDPKNVYGEGSEIRARLAL